MDYRGNAKIALSLKEKLLKLLQNPSTRRKLQEDSSMMPQDRRAQLMKDSNCDIFDLPADEIARQMSLIEWRMWCSIKPYEFLDLAWTKKDKTTRSANVLAMIENFNYLSSWVATRICMTEKTRDRVQLVSKLIDIAQKLRQLNNFNGLMEILSGLNRGPVYRLRQTFAEIEKKKKKKKKKYSALIPLLGLCLISLV
eukprot:TRINITY_DN6988_c0_g1_i1.p1 TRINITY_DN6988_c0_g1~~TRINITY_DN6988_c0_g1_i1.p1  ORF type:complete len:197 (+),score=36.79 TRINITY_DN6988_c0_g1_i1:549-1139(+)